jgi:2-polyprenyl-3-methyl-5-hydroxy-6-metoxy-1,4-benzoquinol methylase
MAQIQAQMESLRSRLQQTWMTGDYDRFSRHMEDGARQYYEHLDIPPGTKLLDVACGSGQLTLMASREGFDSTGVDIAENLIERARERGAAEFLKARFEVADADRFRFRTGPSMWSLALSARCSPRGRSLPLVNSFACVFRAGRSLWRTGPHRAS